MTTEIMTTEEVREATTEVETSKKTPENNKDKSDKSESVKEEKEKEGIIKFSKPYTFENEDYNEIDLSGVKKLTIKDAIEAQKKLTAVLQVMTLTTTEFMCNIAQIATGLPIEFFQLMPRRHSIQVKSGIFEALNLVENKASEDHIMKFHEPYKFEGQEYTEIDLNGIDRLTTMNESEAEDKLIRSGFMISEPSQLFLYCCILASMATGKPEEFFTGLPIEELSKLTSEVNHPDFFE